MDSKSLSVIIPAYNEEGNIHSACEDIARVAEKHLSDYEILVFDDASQDQTSEVVQQFQKENSHVLLFRNPVNKGLGYNYRAGILNARCRYAIMVPGDNEVVADSLEGIFKQVGMTDIIITYATNPEVRPLWRQRVSGIFTGVLNFLFGLNVRYYNGPSVIRTDLAREFVSFTNSFAYMAVILVQLLKSGASFKQMGFVLRARQYGETKAFRLKNVMSVMWDIVSLFWKVTIRRQFKQVLRTQSQDEPEHTRISP